MPFYKNNQRYTLYKNGIRYCHEREKEVATYVEMGSYLNNMASPTLVNDNTDMVLTFTPFPNKYVNYIAQNQRLCPSLRKQVYIQYARDKGNSVSERINS